MQRYDLRSLVKRRRGTRVVLPPVEGSLSAERAYLKALRIILREMAKVTREEIVPQAVSEIRAKDGLTRDVDRTMFQRLLDISVSLAISVEGMVSRIFRLEADRNTDRFMASAKRSLGIDLAAVVRRGDISGYLENALVRNVGLIRNLSEDIVNRVQRAISTAVINGESATSLRKTLTEQFGIADRRAQLIARDQIASLNSDLNKIRQEQAGVTKYEWMTSGDERVRDLHRELDGKTYKWGEPTGAEGGLPPGQPINCRCVARGIVEF